MSRRIPPPKQPIAKPQDSWRTLKPGQFLGAKISIGLPIVGMLPPGTQYKVLAVDSLGAWLAPTDYSSPSEACFDHRFWWVKPDWKASFKRARKPAKPRRKK